MIKDYKETEQQKLNRLFYNDDEHLLFSDCESE